jgi:hypothetical protein
MIKISNSSEEIVRAREDQMVNEEFIRIANINEGKALGINIGIDIGVDRGVDIGIDIQKYNTVSMLMEMGLSFEQALLKNGLTESRYYEIEKEKALRDAKNDSNI